MALHDERNEQNLQRWHARLERERQNLSVSVEATLTDTSIQAEQWTDAADDLDTFMGAARDTALIRPRLSLQSRVIPAISVDGSVVSTTSSHATPAVDVVAGQRSVSMTAQPNMLVRLAQRLSSLLPAMTQTGVLLPEEQKRAVEPEVVDAFPSAQVPLPSIPQAAQSRAQVVGDTGKIRRQTLSMPKITLKPVEAESTILVSEEAQEIKNVSSDVMREETRSTSMHLPVVEMLHREIGHAGRGALSGAGVFEIGQSEVTIGNVNVTASSIVLVTLTANPGPIVVQYVSLQPGVGFTVHLTASASLKASFNYIVLLGELF